MPKIFIIIKIIFDKQNDNNDSNNNNNNMSVKRKFDVEYTKYI